MCTGSFCPKSKTLWTSLATAEMTCDNVVAKGKSLGICLTNNFVLFVIEVEDYYYFCGWRIRVYRAVCSPFLKSFQLPGKNELSQKESCLGEKTHSVWDFGDIPVLVWVGRDCSWDLLAFITIQVLVSVG